jgi:hypothetical protein
MSAVLHKHKRGKIFMEVLYFNIIEQIQGCTVTH